MVKIATKNKKQEVHLHIDKAFAKIESFLPTTYVQLVQEKSQKKLDTTIPTRLIHKVRNRVSNLNLENHIDVITLLVEVANDHKKKIEKLKQITK